jgi:hypothetical protein
MIFLLALGAALAGGASVALQERAAAQVPYDDALKVGLLVRLARRPLWLIDVVASVVGLVLQIWRYATALAVVQPLMATTLVISTHVGVVSDRELHGHHRGRVGPDGQKEVRPSAGGPARTGRRTLECSRGRADQGVLTGAAARRPAIRALVLVGVDRGRRACRPTCAEPLSVRQPEHVTPRSSLSSNRSRRVSLESGCSASRSPSRATGRSRSSSRTSAFGTSPTTRVSP